ncbi:GNAT family N-acetyltransferase [Actinoplanes derwentensis]|uniref:[SSU ribosomal protein S5P]-alanine acetyltransferase n=1 Tax=Actinoplanes derwentensis TaxID=113562 RepID=A0A1H2D3Z9_9ACTN|nr:GNAT family N-acetyltransferase [Actinoplanes derwentensis]GID86019.1 ribosomal-protein-alanine N-acetyltransferase [Actinoplanes derwentensis]SDT77473.1 [SSU ribosomal protein S5P]-alanine acetyltransferase [Actinoplanes derwentensis]
MTGIRLISPADAAEIAALISANREHLAPWDPVREESYYTTEGQWQLISDVLRAGNSLPHAIVEDGRIIGRVNLNNVVHGAFQSASVGYWVSADAAGRGVASAAVAAVVEAAFTTYGLHRVEAGTVLSNVRSQRVLERNGFERFGMAPGYLRIAGEWRDHYLYQLLSDKWLAGREAAA